MNAADPSPEDSPTPDPLAGDRTLWALLDRATPPPAPGPFFVRRVRRAVANLEEEARRTPAWRRWLAERLLAPPARTIPGRRKKTSMVAWSGASFAGVAAAAVLATAIFGLRPVPSAHHRHHRSRPSLQPPPATETPDAAGLDDGTFLRDGDVGVIADLDELLDSNEYRVWQDDDSTS